MAKKSQRSDDSRPDLPRYVRATRVPRRRRSLLFGTHSVRYDVMSADGTVVMGVSIGDVLHGSRYPADYHSTIDAARRHIGRESTGTWVDYPYGRPAVGEVHTESGQELSDGAPTEDTG